MSTKQFKYEDTNNLDIQLKKDMNYTGLKISKLQKGDTLNAIVKSDEELCIVVLTGYINIKLNDLDPVTIGNRMTVFSEEAPFAVYVTAEDKYSLEADTQCELAFCYAPSSKKYESRIINPDSMTIEERGYGQIQRTAKNILPETELADSLLVVEVITRGGNWSSFPSHRHDEDKLPVQSFLEEIYFHKLNPEEGGFALQRVYNDDKSVDEVFTIVNDSAVTVKEGYHPVAVPPAYDLYYLNVMAGPKRIWKFYNDPYFEHLLNQEEK